MTRAVPYRPPAAPIRPRPNRLSDVFGGRSDGWWSKPARVMVLIGLVGTLITASASYTTWRIDRNNEHRLLQLQSRQAANLLSAAILSIQSPLQTTVDIATATDGDVAQFTRFIAGYTGTGGTFASVSLWRTDGVSPVMIASTGDALLPASATTAAVTRATHTTAFDVTPIAGSGSQRIGYALALPSPSHFAVYAERAIPANRRVQIESDSAFTDLHFATYLGATTDLGALQTTDQPPSRLPLRGYTVTESIPFGDTTLTLVTSAAGHLGGSLGNELPWILLVVGLLLTALTTLVVGQLVRRRGIAERDAHLITTLYDRLDDLFAEQRTISETLQNALLPQVNPMVPQLEIGSRYLAGARGIDIGGDWYSIIRLDDTHFGFVVGDVSGRGVEAAALMARIRFTLRAYLFEGHAPSAALELCARQIDINEDLHFATVLVGVGDVSTHTITLANAGHLNPLMLSEDGAHFIETTVGPPLGVARTAYPSTTFSMQPGTMLIAFTDGLVERRTEDLDVSLQRLADVARAAAAPERPVEEMLTRVLALMTGDGTEDDVAILAFRWEPAPAPAVTSS